MAQFSFEKINKYYIYLFILIIGSLLFFPFLGGVQLFDWDEINFSEAAREMLVSGNYGTVQIDFRPFLEKPPLFIWLQAISMHIIGVNEFAARFPNAFLGVLQLMFLFHIGKKWHGKDFGVLWVLLYVGSILPFFYFKSAIIDPWFNFFIFLGFYYFIEYLRLGIHKELSVIISAVFISLAILTKGPVAFLIFALSITILWLFSRKNINIQLKDIAIYLAVLLVIGGSYFAVQIALGNWDIVRDFILYQIRLLTTKDAGHGGFLLYHFVVLFFGVFPASVLAIPALFPNNFKTNRSMIYRLMVIVFWLVLLLFTLVKTKIVHYSSLCYFPLTYLAVLSIEYQSKKQKNLSGWQLGLLLFIALVLFVAVFALQYIGLHAHEFAQAEWIKDKFAKGNLMAEVHWTGFEFLIGLLPLIGVILAFFLHKKRICYQIYAIIFFSLAFVFLAEIVFTPRIEKYSQNAAIEFYQKHANEDCYIEPLGFKSYAHLFYGKRKLENQDKESAEEFQKRILSDAAGKKVYFVTKIDRLEGVMKKYPNLQILYKKNGFVFLTK